MEEKIQISFYEKARSTKIVKQLSSCLIEKYNGFTVIRIEYQKKERKNFQPLDIIYKPTKDLEKEPACYFSTDISLAYSTYFLHGSRMKRASKLQSCHYCNHFFAHNQKKIDRHLKNCSGKPGIIYNFNNQSLVLIRVIILRQKATSLFVSILISRKQHRQTIV